MEIYLLFLLTCIIIGLLKPRLPARWAVILVIGMAFLLSIGYFVLRLV